MTLLGSGGDASSVGYTLDQAISSGSVIRYFPTTKTYSLSSATGGANAEVVGVVESKNITGDLTVVLKGLINYPGLSLNYIDPTTAAGVGNSGGSGGSDIWFLSGITAGELQNLEPDEPTMVAKAVLQTVATSNGYNYQVVNYIGYSIGGDVSSYDGSRLPIGSSLLVPENTKTPDGWIDASTEQELIIANYPDYYTYYGKTNGYTERITLNADTSVISSLVRKGSTQKIGNVTVNTGRVLRVDTVNNKVDVKKTSTQKETDLTLNIRLNNILYIPTAYQVYTIFTPKITTNQIFNVYNEGKLSTDRYKVIHKIKDLGATTIPSKVTVKEVNVTDQLTAGNSAGSYTDVALELTNLLSRVSALENRVTGIS